MEAKRDATIRATTVNTNTMTMSVNAAPQARSVADANGVCALNQISCDSVVLVPWNTLGFTLVVTPMVKSSGAVSPAARATANMAPLTMPGSAVGSATDTTVRQRRAPSASLA